MDRLELRFYSRKEISEATGRKLDSDQFKRDVLHDLDVWGYEYTWHDRKGVTITGRLESNKLRLKELLVEHLELDTQVDPVEFAQFISAFWTVEGFSTMTTKMQGKILSELCGRDISESTITRWRGKLPRIKSWEEIRQEKISYYQGEIERILQSINVIWSSEKLVNNDVIHKSTGKGTVLSAAASKDSANVDVQFMSGKRMLLSLKVSIEKGILAFEDDSLQEKSVMLCARINSLADLRKKVTEWKEANGEALYELIQLDK